MGDFGKQIFRIAREPVGGKTLSWIKGALVDFFHTGRCLGRWGTYPSIYLSFDHLSFDPSFLKY